MTGSKKPRGFSMGVHVTLVVGIVMVFLFAVVYGITSTGSGKMVEKGIDDNGLGFIQSVQGNMAQEIAVFRNSSASFANIVVQQLQGKRIFEKEETAQVGDRVVKKIFVMDGALKPITGDQTMVEAWTEAMGSRFSIFQVTDEGLVRVATTVKDKNGQLLLGGLLDKTSDVYKATVGKAGIYQEEVWLGGLPYAGCYKGVPDGSGKIWIVIFAGVPLEDSMRRVVSSNLGQGSYGLIFDGSGTIVTHPEMERGISMKEKVPSLIKACSDEGVFGKNDPHALSYDYRGRQSRGYVQKIAGTDWYAMIVVDSDLILAPVLSLKKGLLLWTLPLILLGLLVLWFVIRKIVKPLGQVVYVADRIAKADLSIKVHGDEGSRNEIEKVMVAFGRILHEYKQMVAKVIAMNSQFSLASESMGEIAHEVNLALSEVEKSAGEVAEMSNSIAASAQETNAGVAELSTGVAASAAVVTDLSEKAHSVSEGADKGREAVDEVTERTGQAGEASSRVVSAIGELEKSVGGIASFVNTIVSIADQTNLLALNAAIEAARAGEAGRGFAVVAEEVRKLAEESNHAASNIRNVIEHIQTDMTVAAKDTKETGAVMDELLDKSTQAAQEIGEVTKGVVSMAEGIQSIAASSEEQTAGTQEIARAMDAISSMLNKGRDSARSTKEAVDKMGLKLQDLDKIRVDQNDRIEELRNLTAPYRLEEHAALEG